jgi:uncharacterized protein YdeI (YjbR/CyaY-like superfamily)
MGEHVQAFEAALSCDELAHQTFKWLAPSHRYDFLDWIQSAGVERERLNRIQAAIDILAGREVVRRN